MLSWDIFSIIFIAFCKFLCCLSEFDFLINELTIDPTKVLYNRNNYKMFVHILHIVEVFFVFLLPPTLSPLIAEGIVGAVKCLTMEGKLSWRIGSAWRSKSGTKTLLSFSPSIHPSCLRLSPSFTLISSLEISLRRLSAGKLVSSASLRQQLFHLHWPLSAEEGWEGAGERACVVEGWGGQHGPGKAKKLWCSGEAASSRGTQSGKGGVRWADWREGLANWH